MSPVRPTRRDRDALLAAILPAPGRGLPALGDVDLEPFWPRFDASAPLHLRWGLRAAVVVIGTLPWGLGYFRSLGDLGDDELEVVVTRAHGLPVLRELVEVAKVVACLAYFSDPAVQATARGRT